MRPIEKFDRWIKEHPDKLKIIQDYASEKFSYTEADFGLHIYQLRDWLIRKEGTKSANKKLWGAFIKRNLKSKEVRKSGYGNKEYSNKPSVFKGVTGRRKLS